MADLTIEEQITLAWEAGNGQRIEKVPSIGMSVFSVPSPPEKDALKIILLVGKSQLFNIWLMTASDFHACYELMIN